MFGPEAGGVGADCDGGAVCLVGGDAIRRLGDRIDIVHLKDEVGFPTLRQKNHIWFGGGIVDFAEVRQALDDVGFEGVASVEWEGWVAGGSLGVGEPSGVGLADFDRVCVEAAAWVGRYGFSSSNEGRR